MAEYKHIPDVDIDMADRNDILNLIPHIKASKVDDNKIDIHNVGVYFQKIPTDPLTNLSSIDYKKAELDGYIKVDFLNLDVYQKINSNQEIERLLAIEPEWNLLTYEKIVDKLFHLSGNYHIVQKIKPRSVIDLAICVALKMPAKKYLLDKNINEIRENIWKKEQNPIFFKKSHSVAYASVIKIQLNYFVENPQLF